MSSGPALPSDAIERYLILIDISGYTRFLAGVERTHGDDYTLGLPAGYRVLGELMQRLVDGLAPELELIKVEGDAVFGTAAATELDGRGEAVVHGLAEQYRAFTSRRDVLAATASDDRCTACFAIAGLDLKAVIHRGVAVRQPVGGSTDLIGPAVIAAHRLLKNTVRDRIGARPYVLLTQAAADKLGLAERGLAHHEAYPDVGQVECRVIDLADAAGIPVTTAAGPLPASGAWPEIRISDP